MSVPEKLPLQINMALPANPFVKAGPPPNKFTTAVELDKQGKHGNAEKLYQEMLNADFDNPIVLAAYGMNLASQEKNGLGAHMLRAALKDIDGMIDGFKRLGIATNDVSEEALKKFCATKRAEVLNALGTCYKHENNVPMAREHFLAAQACVPPNADIQNNIATLYINEGKPEEALGTARLPILKWATTKQAGTNTITVSQPRSATNATTQPPLSRLGTAPPVKPSSSTANKASETKSCSPPACPIS
jgi:tetratricopeptide (TPR) repeat protein